MATTTKEPTPSSPLAHDGTLAAPKSGPSPRTEATGAEIPVIVHASRYSLAGGDAGKALPALHEQTSTVVIFPQGCVVRLSAGLSIGELVVLTNQQSGTDVLCRVTSSKSQQGIHNYVDLEFTQSAPRFWGEGVVAGRSGETPMPAAASLASAPGAAPIALAPLQAPASTSPFRVELPPPAYATTPATHPAPLALPIAAQNSSPSEPWPARPPADAGRFSLAQTGEREDLAAPAGQGVGGARISVNLKKGMLVVGAAIVMVVLAAILLLPARRSASVSPASAATSVATAPQSAPLRTPGALPVGASPADASRVPDAAKPAPVSSAAAFAAERSAEGLDSAQSAEPKSDSASAPAPRRDSLAVGKLALPIRRRAAIAGSSEPPPLLLTQGNTASDTLLPASLLAGNAASPEPPVRLGGQLQAPKVISSSAPIYPAFARAAKLEGVVVLDVLVDATGKVSRVDVVSGPPALQQAAIEAVKQSKYQPARLNGQAIAIHTNVNISFSLQ